ncbi:MAG: hypothetical protein IAG13_35330, partial [Deltaproteobacteria bacterium]|nr:hypothetical protein [Nannocystaceae bacterium]
MKDTSSLSARILGAAMAVSLGFTVPACGDGGTDRWVTTENSAVDIDWDAVAKAYKEAEGPEDLEQRVNEIYAGDEIISVSVKDNDEKTQVVTGFFDKNEDGKVDEGEQIFTIQRDLQGEKGQYQIAGAGPYAGYHSPVWDIAMGMVMGSMMSRMFMPGYTPMYSQGYTTNPARRGALASHRDSWRQANPDQHRAQQSKSGKSYGKKGRRRHRSPRPSCRSSCPSCAAARGAGREWPAAPSR